MKTKQIDERGILSAGDYLELPVRLYSRSGSFYREIHSEAELLQFLEDHRATPGALFDVEEVWRYYLEQPGDVAYRVDTDLNSTRAEKARQMLDDRFVIY